MKIITDIISHIILNVKMNITAAYHTNKLTKARQSLIKSSFGVLLPMGEKMRGCHENFKSDVQVKPQLCCGTLGSAFFMRAL